MTEIRDFKCTYDNSAGINKEVTEGKKLSFPDAYLYRESMVILAKALKEHDHAGFYELPFDHTLEAEAVGGIINYGNELAGPRAKEYICTKPEELLALPEINLDKGRIHEVLLACKDLLAAGEDVVLEISGPFTIMNVLIDPKYVFKGMRKNPELMKEVFKKFGNYTLSFIKKAQKYGVKLFSYADSAGGVNILGPKMASWVVENFTVDFLKEVEVILEEDSLCLLCPKTTYTLVDTNKAKFVEIKVSDEAIAYGKACFKARGKAKFVGQNCIKNIRFELKEGKIKSIELN